MRTAFFVGDSSFQLRRRLLFQRVAPSRRGCSRLASAQRAHVSDDLPDLCLRYSCTPSGHATRTPFDDRVVDVLGLPSILERPRHQRRPHAAPTLRMTARAVVPIEQSLSFRDGERTALGWTHYADIAGRSAGSDRAFPGRDVKTALG